eukprot:14727990-Alexandrium_andersonii.AAC.1
MLRPQVAGSRLPAWGSTLDKWLAVALRACATPVGSRHLVLGGDGRAVPLRPLGSQGAPRRRVQGAAALPP